MDKPKHFKNMDGQYIFLNCPDVSWWQWHPFSIASSGRNDKIRFMIKNNGDFTKSLIKLLAKHSVEVQRIDTEMAANGSEINLAKENTLSHMCPVRINLSHPINSPCCLSKFRKSVMYVGAGAGLATFMGFIDRQYLNATKGDHKNGEKMDSYIPEDGKVEVVFISRELEHMEWIAEYIDGVLRLPEMTSRMKFHIYITIKEETNTLCSFLFWRAMTLLSMKNDREHGKGLSLCVNLGRPKFDRLLGNMLMNTDEPNSYVYACGPSVMTTSVESLCIEKSTQDKKLIFNYEIF